MEDVRTVPEETAVAITCNGTSQAVMMATPADLEDFAIGFALTEGLIENPAEIERIEIVPLDLGIEARLWVIEARADALQRRRRRMAGPVGCGLCGIESLVEAMRPVARVAERGWITPNEIVEAMAGLRPLQALNAATRAVHAAAFWQRGRGITTIREDVGRHNALDKLAGALAREGVPSSGALLLTSRRSVEMIQKSARIGAEIVVAVSAPTALAIRAAEEAGITLVGVARADGFEVFTHTHRIVDCAEVEALQQKAVPA
nr:formate dehydrogenase accessory sulfurtransferase FdhD [Arsenicitalea aurantiaca]